MNKSAILALADGSIFRGTSIGADGEYIGEAVFNTSMTGYQEILTDPSYNKQIVTLTYPHIGNTGINLEDEESTDIFCGGLVIKDLPRLASNFRSEMDLSSYLVKHGKVGIADVDTRRLTRILREKGAQGACLSTKVDDPALLVAKARDFGGLEGLDLAKEVTVKEAYEWSEATWRLGAGYQPASSSPEFKVVAYDFGVKRNILRILVGLGAKVIVVPATTSAEEALSYQPDGIFLSNGPGDPEPCEYALEAIRVFLDKNIPLFGICLGHQLLALASGAKTQKMKFGHHGANHPVRDEQSGRVLITSQNHGFAVDEEGLPTNLQVTHRSLFDGTLQGLRRDDKPAYGFQGHPEASPGPQEAEVLFEPFFEAMRNCR